MRYEIPPFNSSELTKSGEAVWFDFKIGVPGDNSDNKGDGKKVEVLEPHTIRLTSVPETPLSFEGINVQKALIRQGKDWIEEQDKRVVMEFIGEGSDAEREGGFFGKPAEGEKERNQDIWRNSVQYRVGEALGVRHSHMSAGMLPFRSPPLSLVLTPAQESASSHPATKIFLVSHLNTSRLPPFPIPPPFQNSTANLTPATPPT